MNRLLILLGVQQRRRNVSTEKRALDIHVDTKCASGAAAAVLVTILRNHPTDATTTLQCAHLTNRQ